MFTIGSVARRVGRVSRIDIYVQTTTRRNALRVTVAIRSIRFAARGSHLRTSRRLSVLPHFGERNTALGGNGRVAGKHAPKRRAAMIIADEEMDFPSAGVVADIARSHDRGLAGFSIGDAGTVHAAAIAALHDAVDPGMNIGALLGKHSSSLLLVEKNDRPLREPVIRRRLYCLCRIADSDTGRIARCL